MADSPYELIIVGLLPLTACLLVTQANPYHALVIRGILGAVAALVYALFGAADVALTEALVGTMLSITLYAVAVRSSLSLRIGLVDALMTQTAPEGGESATLTTVPPSLTPLLPALKQRLRRRHLRLELVSYATPETLERAIAAKEIHAIYRPSPSGLPHRFEVRTQALHTLLQAELPPSAELSVIGAEASIHEQVIE
ncbi:MAG: hydrogenase subunit MbhD domain-containing protein [Elainellaceae cyanobacterium]